MKRSFTRVLCLALALAALLTLAPAPARAADEGQKLIALTFDDGPSVYTEQLLDALEERGAVATFFLCGRNGGNGLATYGDLLPRMLALGCQTANHSYGHPQFTKLSAASRKSQIASVEDYLYAAAGQEFTEVVRIPYGENTAAIRASVDRPMILWSVDPYDWRDRNADVVYRRIMNNAHDGAIILLHDLYLTSVQAGIRAIDSLREQGYELVTVSELFRRHGVELQNGRVYIKAPNEGVDLPAYSAPKITAVSDGVVGQLTVSFASAEGEFTYRYTTDGSEPTLASPAYREPFIVDRNVELRVAGYDKFLTRTPTAHRTLHIHAARPQIASEEAGRITLTCETAGAEFLYTTDGRNPIVYGEPYTGAFEPGEVTRVVARAEGLFTSAELTIVKTESGALFRDVTPDAWYRGAVSDAVKRGIMSGEGGWRFYPDASLTRSVVVAVLYRLAGSPAVSAPAPFRDVSQSDWYASAVQWAYENGIVTDDGSHRFDPAGAATREQAAVLLYRYAACAGMDVAATNRSAALRAQGASAYATDALSWCLDNGIMNGDEHGRLTPAEQLTRAQWAMMLSVFCPLAERAAR